VQQIFERYASKAQFLAIYVREAHPTDEWQMTSNETEGVCYAQPLTLDDRRTIARDFATKHGWKFPLAIDRMDNAAEELYAAWPERFYVIDEHGVIAYKGKTGPFGYHPEEVEAWLAERFPDVAASGAPR
jgi:hypothetical protein